MSQACTCSKPLTRSRTGKETTTKKCPIHQYIDTPTTEELFIEELNKKSSSSKKNTMTGEMLQTLQNFTLQLAENTQRHEERFDKFLQSIDKQQKDLNEKIMQKNKSIRPPKCFTGSGDKNVSDFFNQFDRYVKFNVLNADERLLAFPSCLDGLALQYYESLATEIKDDFGKVRDSFMNRYEPEKMRIFKTESLYNRKMQKGETLQDYTLAITTEANRLKLTENETKQVFIQGLPSSLKEYTLLQNPTTMHEAQEAAESKHFAQKTTQDTDQRTDSLQSNVNSLLPQIRRLIKEERQQRREEMEVLKAEINTLHRDQQRLCSARYGMEYYEDSD